MANREPIRKTLHPLSPENQAPLLLGKLRLQEQRLSRESQALRSRMAHHLWAQRARLRRAAQERQERLAGLSNIKKFTIAQDKILLRLEKEGMRLFLQLARQVLQHSTDQLVEELAARLSTELKQLPEALSCSLTVHPDAKKGVLTALEHRDIQLQTDDSIRRDQATIITPDGKVELTMLLPLDILEDQLTEDTS